MRRRSSTDDEEDLANVLNVTAIGATQNLRRSARIKTAAKRSQDQPGPSSAANPPASQQACTAPQATLPLPTDLDEPDSKKYLDPEFYRRTIEPVKDRIINIRDETLNGVIDVIIGSPPPSYLFMENPMFSRSFLVRNDPNQFRWQFPHITPTNLSFIKRLYKTVNVYICDTQDNRYQSPSGQLKYLKSTMKIKEVEEKFREDFSKRKAIINVLNNYIHTLDVDDEATLESFSPPAQVNAIELYSQLNDDTRKNEFRSCDGMRMIQMGMRGAYTPFHVDYSGTSPVFYMAEGVKIIWLVSPTPQNLDAYDKFNPLNFDQHELFGKFDNIYEMILYPKDYCFFIGLHAVYTTQDSLVFTNAPLFTSTIQFQRTILENPEGDNFIRVPCHEELILVSSPKILSDIFMMMMAGLEESKLLEMVESWFVILKRLQRKLNNEEGKKAIEPFQNDPVIASALKNNMDLIQLLMQKTDPSQKTQFILMREKMMSELAQDEIMTVYGIPISKKDWGKCDVDAQNVLFGGPYFPCSWSFDGFTNKFGFVFPSFSRPPLDTLKEDYLRHPIQPVLKLCNGANAKCNTVACRKMGHPCVNLHPWTREAVRFVLSDDELTIRASKKIKKDSMIGPAFGELVFSSAFPNKAVTMIRLARIKTNSAFPEMVYMDFEQKTNFAGLMRRSPSPDEFNCKLLPGSIRDRLTVIVVATRDIKSGDELILCGRRTQYKLKFGDTRRDLSDNSFEDSLIMDSPVPLHANDIRSLAPGKQITRNLFQYIASSVLAKAAPELGEWQVNFLDDWSDLYHDVPLGGSHLDENQAEYNYLFYIVRNQGRVGLMILCLKKYNEITPKVFEGNQRQHYPYILFVDITGNHPKEDVDHVIVTTIKMVRRRLPEVEKELKVGTQSFQDVGEWTKSAEIHCICRFVNLFVKEMPCNRKSLYMMLAKHIQSVHPSAERKFPSIFEFLLEHVPQPHVSPPRPRRTRRKSRNPLNMVEAESEEEEDGPSVPPPDIEPGPSPNVSPAGSQTSSKSNDTDPVPTPNLSPDRPPNATAQGPVSEQEEHPEEDDEDEMDLGGTRDENLTFEEVHVEDQGDRTQPPENRSPGELAIVYSLSPQSQIDRGIYDATMNSKLILGFTPEKIRTSYSSYLGPNISRIDDKRGNIDICKFLRTTREAVRTSIIFYSLTTRRDQMKFIPVITSIFLAVLQDFEGKEMEPVSEKFITLAEARAAFAELNPKFIEEKLCVPCKKVFKERLNRHAEADHLIQPRFQCPRPTCQLPFQTLFLLNDHLKFKPTHRVEPIETDNRMTENEILERLSQDGWTITNRGREMVWRLNEIEQNGNDLNPVLALLAGIIIDEARLSKFDQGSFESDQLRDKNILYPVAEPMSLDLKKVITAAFIAKEDVIQTFDRKRFGKPQSGRLFKIFRIMWKEYIKMPMEELNKMLRFRSPEEFYGFLSSINPTSLFPVWIVHPPGQKKKAKKTKSSEEGGAEEGGGDDGGGGKWVYICPICGDSNVYLFPLFKPHALCQQ